MTNATTVSLLDRLKRHYIKPGADMAGGSFLPEVGQNGGWGAGSRCDAIYVGYTSTSGRILVGHELKVSRADWLNELNHPGKSDAWADQCHEWYLVVPDPSIVHDGELPPGWGVMSPSRRSSTRMQVHTKAARKDPAAHRPSWDAVRSIMARQDTMCREAILADRAKQRESVNAEVEQRVAQANGIERSWRDRAGYAEDRLDKIMMALGGYAALRWDEEQRRWGATPDELAKLVRMLKLHGDVQSACAELFGDYADPLSRIDAAANKLRAVLQGIEKTGGDV